MTSNFFQLFSRLAEQKGYTNDVTGKQFHGNLKKELMKMERRKALKLLGVATATGAVTGISGAAKAAQVESSLEIQDVGNELQNIKWTPFASGVGYYAVVSWSDGEIGFMAVLGDWRYNTIQHNGQKVWNPLFGARHTPEDFHRLKYRLLDYFEKAVAGYAKRPHTLGDSSWTYRMYADTMPPLPK